MEKQAEMIKLNDKKTSDEVDLLKYIYMSKFPLWASVIGDVPILVQTHSIAGQDLRPLTKVGATDGGRVYLLPDFWKNSSIDVKVGVVAHEYEHIIRMHSFRMGKRDSMAWNIACDHTINLSLLSQDISLPTDHLADTKYVGWEEERIYADIVDKSNGKITIELDVNGQPIPSGKSVVIQPCNEDGSAMTVDQIENAKSEMASAVKMAQSMEKKFSDFGDADGRRSLSELNKPKVNWRNQMRKFINSSGPPIGNTWLRLDRRAASIGFWLPSEVRNSVEWVVVGFDVSSSVSERETNAFFANLNKIMSSVNVKRMTIVPFNCSVITSEIIELGGSKKKIEKIVSGGGTRVQPFLNWVKSQKKRPSCVLILSDMEFDFNLKSHGIDPLWVSTMPISTMREKPSFGKLIEINV